MSQVLDKISKNVNISTCYKTRFRPEDVNLPMVKQMGATQQVLSKIPTPEFIRYNESWDNGSESLGNLQNLDSFI